MPESERRSDTGSRPKAIDPHFRIREGTTEGNVRLPHRNARSRDASRSPERRIGDHLRDVLEEIDVSRADHSGNHIVQPPIVDDILARANGDDQVDLDRLGVGLFVRQDSNTRVEAHGAERDIRCRMHQAASMALRISRAKVTAFDTLSLAAWTIALPMTTPSAMRATAVACAAVDTPKPTQIGRVVDDRRRFIVSGKSDARDCWT